MLFQKEQGVKQIMGKNYLSKAYYLNIANSSSCMFVHFFAESPYKNEVRIRNTSKLLNTGVLTWRGEWDAYRTFWLLNPEITLLDTATV